MEAQALVQFLGSYTHHMHTLSVESTNELRGRAWREGRKDVCIHTSGGLHPFCWQWQQHHNVQHPWVSGQMCPGRSSSLPVRPETSQSPHVSWSGPLHCPASPVGGRNRKEISEGRINSQDLQAAKKCTHALYAHQALSHQVLSPNTPYINFSNTTLLKLIG